MKTLFQVVKNASERVDEIEDVDRPVGGRIDFYGRTKYSVLASALSEFGELAEEINIDQRHSYKTQGKDGVIGEAIDTIACLLDLIHVHDPELTEHDIMTIAAEKCAKWVSKVAEDKGVKL